MYKFKALYKWVNSPYQDFWWRIIVSVISAHVIVSHGYGFFAVLSYPGYLISLIGSSIVAFILFTLVNIITVLLDRYLSWYTSFNRRLLWQATTGVLLMALVAYGLADRLFVYMGEDIEQSDYMTYDFYFICLYIILINIYYYLYYRFNRKRAIKRELLFYKNYHRNFAFKHAPANLVDVDLAAFGIEPTTIACMCWIDGVLKFYDMAANLKVATEQQKDILKELDKSDYLMINRYCTVHRLLVLDIKPASSRRVSVILRAPFNSLIPEDRKETSQGHTSDFLKEFDPKSRQ